MQATNLTEYLNRYGALIAERTKTSFAPLHVPARDKPLALDLKRKPFDAQAHAVTAIVKAWKHNKSVILCAEMGTGKTMMGIAAVHGAQEGPYRALVFAPDHLVGKWAREIEETLHGASVRRIAKWSDVLHLPRSKPTGPEWVVIGRNMAKLSSGWRAAFLKDRYGVLHCPRCYAMLVKTCDKEGENTFWTADELGKSRRYCKDCGEPLYQNVAQPRKWAPASIIQRRMRGYFKYLIIDECHEEAKADSAQAMAAGSLIAACGKVLALTGTLLNGYADSVFPLMFRLFPGTLLDEGLSWKNVSEFTRRYGRVDIEYVERSGSTTDNRQSRGRSTSKNEKRRPGIMPTLYGRHMIGNTVFLSLEEVAAGLKRLGEIPTPVVMSGELSAAYRKVEEALMDEVKQLLRRGNKRLLGTMLQTLLAYPDYPYDWDEIGYKEGDDGWRAVVTPESLDKHEVWPKEKKLLEILRKEKAEGRQVWVYVQYTDKHPVLARLEQVISKAGFKVKTLKSTVPLKDRETWIQKNAPGLDVVISHPKLVETGLDLFSKDGSYNFPSIVFYETGYNLFTLRQSSRRGWRIGQRKDCRTYYLYYSGTMQDKAMALMGKKLKASLTLEGKFSSEGLVALSGDEGSAEMELAKSLAERIDFGNAERVWQLAGDMPELDDDWQEMDDWIAEVQAEAERRKAEKARRNAEILAKLDELFDDWDDDLPGGRSAPITEVAAA
jgi:SNF2 family DNA or RNA helicase